MNLISAFNDYKTQSNFIDYLEQVRWSGNPTCPYCNSDKTTKYKSSHRHHCRPCNKAFSVTVGTIYHDTRLPLKKWFLATVLISSHKKISVRELAEQIEVNKDTAWRMERKIREAMSDKKQSNLFSNIVEFSNVILSSRGRKIGKKLTIN